MKTDALDMTPVPTKWVGPIQITGSALEDEVSVPLATYESPLWPSVARGAKLSRLCGGIACTLVDSRMSRSVIMRSHNAQDAVEICRALEHRKSEMQEIVARTSRFAKLIDINFQIVGHLIYLRFECQTGDASGHNMVTQAAEALLNWILGEYSNLSYASISGNFCTDKKVSAVNGILGRGHYVVAEIEIPAEICEKHLRTTPEKIVQLNIEKNLIGGILAGSLRSANAHFANMLLAFYLATGQDAANIIEGSQGMTHCEIRGGDLYFSVTLPNLILGTVGNGKSGAAIEEALNRLGCRDDRPPGENAKRLAAICAASVLCGELSLMAAQTNPGELMRTHRVMER